MHIIMTKEHTGVIIMSMKNKITNKLLQATSDKTDLNRRMLSINKSFVEINKTLGENTQKYKKNK